MLEIIGNIQALLYINAFEGGGCCIGTTLLGPGSYQITGRCEVMAPCFWVMSIPSRLGHNQATTPLTITPAGGHSLYVCERGYWVLVGSCGVGVTMPKSVDWDFEFFFFSHHDSTCSFKHDTFGKIDMLGYSTVPTHLCRI